MTEFINNSQVSNNKGAGISAWDGEVDKTLEIKN